MALVTAFDQAKQHRIRKMGDGKDILGLTLLTQFFGSAENPDVPVARLSEVEPGGASGVHYHEVDEIHIVLDGRGTLGRRELKPYYVHFARAYTPYGPLLADPAVGLSLLQLCAHADPGSRRLPEKRDELTRMANRKPWQITVQPALPDGGSGADADAYIEEVSDFGDDSGLSAHILTMKPNAKLAAPDPSHGGGQYVVVVRGGLLQNGVEHRALTLVFVSPTEGAFTVQAGGEGLQAFVFNFPRAQGGAKGGAQANADFKSWECRLCSFTYDESAGMPLEAIAPGTRWKDVPEDWKCPDCSASKRDFTQVAP